MKSLILYALPVGVITKRPGYFPVRAGDRKRTTVYVRAAIGLGEPIEALKFAHCRRGETVLNTIPIP